MVAGEHERIAAAVPHGDGEASQQPLEGVHPPAHICTQDQRRVAGGRDGRSVESQGAPEDVSLIQSGVRDADELVAQFGGSASVDRSVSAHGQETAHHTTVRVRALLGRDATIVHGVVDGATSVALTGRSSV